MNPSNISKSGKETEMGFTLIEVLVACSVLVLLVVLVAQMVGSASLVTKESSRRMDADDEARMVFDRMSEDFAQIPKRADMNPLFLGTNGNDQLYFYSQAPGISTNGSSSNSSGIGLIGYQVMSNGLARLGVAQSWDDLSFSSNALVTAYNNQVYGGSTNFHIIAPSVFRMEFALRMKPGSTNNTNGLGPMAVSFSSATVNGTNVVFQTNNAGQGLQDVAAIIVTLGILDQTSQLIVTDANLSNLASVSIMSDAITNSGSGVGLINGSGNKGIAADTWRTNALTLSTGIPQAARSQIRIYQRTFPISP